MNFICDFFMLKNMSFTTNSSNAQQNSFSSRTAQLWHRPYR
ncbi:hypothetical protein NC653_041687 [Populus alba x Populus x berolinensis]|uniref:Uncharacterized protein n=1 Tax=Populus alba x Populus x berolinensis TaxID=444605 RepID=A0AAD6L996_9ROSI|nr:hypothetical protein NC653_041687 [Populus alba x Populus x berolinensis]